MSSTGVESLCCVEQGLYSLHKYVQQSLRGLRNPQPLLSETWVHLVVMPTSLRPRIRACRNAVNQEGFELIDSFLEIVSTPEGLYRAKQPAEDALLPFSILLANF